MRTKRNDHIALFDKDPVKAAEKALTVLKRMRPMVEGRSEEAAPVLEEREAVINELLHMAEEDAHSEEDVERAKEAVDELYEWSIKAYEHGGEIPEGAL